MKETKYWTGHIFAGVALLLLLGFHFAYTHIAFLFGTEDNITESLSKGRDARPAFLAFFIVLLGLGLYHGLYGLKNILSEVVTCDKCRKIIAALLTIAGILLFAFGSYSSFVAHKNAASAGSAVSRLEVNNG